VRVLGAEQPVNELDFILYLGLLLTSPRLRPVRLSCAPLIKPPTTRSSAARRRASMNWQLRLMKRCRKLVAAVLDSPVTGSCAATPFDHRPAWLSIPTSLLLPRKLGMFVVSSQTEPSSRGHAQREDDVPCSTTAQAVPQP
jgi:hypothetical protein